MAKSDTTSIVHEAIEIGLSMARLWFKLTPHDSGAPIRDP
jgi:hypothetical protein